MISDSMKEVLKVVFSKDGTYAQEVSRGCVFQGRHVRAKGEEGLCFPRTSCTRKR